MAQLGTAAALVTTLSVAIAGCAVESKGDGPACRLMGAPHQRLNDTQEALCTEVTESQRALLDFYFGRYVSGEVPVYRGQADGQDNASAIGMPSGSMSGDAIAVLLPHDTEAGQMLDVFVVESGMHMTVRRQDTDPAALILTHVMDRWTSGGGAPVSSGDVVLSPAPERFDFSLMSTGEWGNGAPLSASLTAMLERADASEMTATEVFLLVPDRSLDGDFEQRQHERVREWEDTWLSSVETRPGFARCARLTPYTLEQYVHEDTIADHGLRNVTLGPSRVCCSDVPCVNPEGGCPGLDQCVDD